MTWLGIDNWQVRLPVSFGLAVDEQKIEYIYGWDCLCSGVERHSQVAWLFELKLWPTLQLCMSCGPWPSLYHYDTFMFELHFLTMCPENYDCRFLNSVISFHCSFMSSFVRLDVLFIILLKNYISVTSNSCSDFFWLLSTARCHRRRLAECSFMKLAFWFTWLVVSLTSWSYILL